MIKTQKSLEGFKRLKLEPYDVIISGIEMAFPDGFELNRLKKETMLNAETPIVMITSNLSDNQKIRMVREGIGLFSVRSLFQCAIGQSRGRRHPAPQEGTP